MDDFLGRNSGQMQCRGMLHIVEAGDTLYKIARKYGVPLSRVIYANPYVNVYNLQVGDEICVPVMMPRMPAQPPAAGRQDQMQMVPDQLGSAASQMPQSQMGSMMPGSPMGNGAMPGSPMGNGAMPGSPMGNGTMPGSPMGNGVMPGNSMGNGAMPGNPMDNAAMLGNPMDNGAMPGGQMGNGMMPAVQGSQMADGMMPSMPDGYSELIQPENQMEHADPAMPGSGMEGAMPHNFMENQTDSGQMEDQRNDTEIQMEENGSENQLALSGEVSADGRNYFAEMQETEKIQQTEELQQAFEKVSGSVCHVHPEPMPWENTVVTESMMEDYLST